MELLEADHRLWDLAEGIKPMQALGGWGGLEQITVYKRAEEEEGESTRTRTGPETPQDQTGPSGLGPILDQNLTGLSKEVEVELEG